MESAQRLHPTKPRRGHSLHFASRPYHRRSYSDFLPCFYALAEPQIPRWRACPELDRDHEKRGGPGDLVVLTAVHLPVPVERAREVWNKCDCGSSSAGEGSQRESTTVEQSSGDGRDDNPEDLGFRGQAPIIVGPYLRCSFVVTGYCKHCGWGVGDQ